MHRDHKLGLALGVLVVGFAAALCFPKQGDVDQRLLQLENTADLDEEISQLAVHAYTNADPEPVVVQEPPRFPADDFDRDSLELVPGGDGEHQLLAGPPAPIGATIVIDDLFPDDLDLELPPASESPAGPVNPSTPAIAEAVPADWAEYTVRPGDTLSSLAAKFLDDPNRYLELFDANREVLASPNDLRPGTVLVIPGIALRDDRPGPAEQSLAESGDNANDELPRIAPAVESPDRDGLGRPGEGRPLFRPAGTAPFLKTQPVSRGHQTPLPPMDASQTRRETTSSADEPSPVRSYTVRRGDTLEAIAVRTYGNPLAVRDLLEANQDVVRDPRRLKPGMTLTLPERE